MSETLTLELIRDAQNNGLKGLEAVNSAMASRIRKLADAAARRMSDSYSRIDDHREDFRQDAAVALFEALPRFKGNTVEMFYGFMWGTIEDRLKDKVREERNGGADMDAVKVFGAMVERAGGDVFLAEKMAQTVPPKGRRLSADRAAAARLAWQGAASLDFPFTTFYNTDGGSRTAPDGTVTVSLGEYLVDRYNDMPEDLVTSEDVTKEVNRVKHALVHAVLDSMGANQANALRHSYGIGNVRCYGTGDSGDLEGLADELGITPLQARDARTKGHKAFAKRYIKAVARDAAHEAELTEAAAINLGRGGRK
ncbi:hypothetical protein [Streptomyces sp. NRRL S-31]|uniref:hypothetical protein n=1 Tax=Streptomyces sp. NRRL S-31 TaxID=1463898 RepID=UPI000699E4E1|nr:hypothetical protein [Streptomyces sp. NRRL S-31]